MKKLLIFILTLCSISGLSQILIDPSTGSITTTKYNTAIQGKVVASGTDTYTLSYSLITSYTDVALTVQFTNANTGTSTLNINGIGATTIKKQSGGSLVNLSANDIGPNDRKDIYYDGTFWILKGGTGASTSGTVTTVSVTTANGVSGSVANATTTPAISLTLGAITPTSVNGTTSTEIGYVSGVTSAIQTQLNSKQASGSYAVTTNNLSDLSSASTARTNLGLGTAATISSTAGGDLSGTLPSPTVSKIKGNTVPADASGVLTNDGAGNLTWGASGSSGTVTNIATTAPITGGPITTTGTIGISDATTGAKGAASFNSNDFDVASGAVTIDYVNGQAASATNNGFINTTTQTIAGAKTFSSTISGSISGNAGTATTASNLSGTPALPNGTTVTTQTPGDATTKIANDAFVSAAITAAALPAADASHDGYLTQTDWTNFNNKLSANQTITFAPTGDVTGSTTGTTSLTPVFAIGVGKVTNTMLAGSIDLTSKVTGVLPIANGGIGSTVGAWLLSGTSNIAGNTTQSGAFTNTSALNGELITQNALSSGHIPALKITPGTHTAMQLSTEFPAFTLESATQTHATGTLTTQRDFWAKAQTHAFAGASTLTNAYTGYFERPIAGTNATITHPYALGTNGDVKIASATATSTDYVLEVVTNTNTNAFRVTGNAITQVGQINSFGTGNGIGFSSGNTASSAFTFGHLNNVALNSNNLINTAGLLALTQNSTLNCTMLRLAQTINNSGSGPYNIYAVHYIPTETSLTSTNHYSFVSDSQTALGGTGGATPHSSWFVNGSFGAAYVAKTGTYTATVNDYTIDCTSGTFTVTLPTAVGIAGRLYVISNSGAGTITIGTTSSQTFANVTATPTTLTMATVGARTVQSNGANWILISSL